ncbi:hypothetical protein [Idiomarina piscisalsi]|uniref:Uncharacterized protein n=1 Tax=Idiomarina piscisalsi TaxID=1096243 RepID=A0A432YXF1_9GAMM|nr:hypothetical protein [Idiomarina piscisalsi]RUO67995.1 hypothetical protein CWI73_03825 [Idiomarina piscisalsi]
MDVKQLMDASVELLFEMFSSLSVDIVFKDQTGSYDPDTGYTDGENPEVGAGILIDVEDLDDSNGLYDNLSAIAYCESGDFPASVDKSFICEIDGKEYEIAKLRKHSSGSYVEIHLRGV